MEKVYRNTAILIILIIAGVQWGFYATYTSEFPHFKNKTITIHVHGALLMTWLVLLVVQPLLIRLGKAKLHKSIGKLSYVLGPLIIIFLFLIGRGSYNRGIGVYPENDMLRDMVLDIRGFLSFAVFWSLAMLYRKDTDAHMRYMIATGILAIGPGVGRGLISTFGFDLMAAIRTTDFFDLALVGILLGFDVFRKKNYRPFLVVFLVLLAGTLLWQVSNSAAWQSFARMYAALFY